MELRRRRVLLPVNKGLYDVYFALNAPTYMMYDVKFEILTAAVTKSTIFWDIKPCSPLKVSRRFRGTCRLHLQGRRISRARNKRESRWQSKLL
jgi:hypothetical protein